MKNETKFKELMSALGELFDKEISPVLSNIYWKSLENISDDDAINGFNKSFTFCKFFPKPAELIDLMKPKIPVEDKALAIANEIISHLRLNGSRKRPDLSHDPIAEQLMTTRWNYPYWASQVLESEIRWWIKDFCDAYRAYKLSNQYTAIEYGKHGRKDEIPFKTEVPQE